ncbi:MAG: hypothetical protein HW380_2256 [Magnetococcales bacterium]|nr:hypothetical protein [Magnetococcales bacterium]
MDPNAKPDKQACGNKKNRQNVPDCLGVDFDFFARRVYRLYTWRDGHDPRFGHNTSDKEALLCSKPIRAPG